MSIRVHQLAKKLKIDSPELVKHLKAVGVEVKGHMSALDEKEVKGIQKKIEALLKKPKKPAKASAKLVKATKKPAKAKAKPKAKPKPKTKTVKPKVEKPKVVEPKVEKPRPKTVPGAKAVKPKVEKPKAVIPPKAKPEPAKPKVVVPEKKLAELKVDFPITVKDLSVKLQVKPNELIKRLMNSKIFATINQTLPEEVAVEIASGFGYALQKAPSLEEQLLDKHKEEGTANLLGRSPVITMMGHVDHGKTSLLDVMRKTNVTEREAGGITQHIGAYRVSMERGDITFLDTPGHEAFTAMRARGANATDIVILVVAADDGVMPQTVEAIDHAKAAGVPIVVAINKIDRPNADIDKTKQQLSDLDLKPEDWGGKTITVGVSAKTQEGIDKLLEMVLLEAEMLELKANPDKPANGVVIEGRLSRGKGAVATVLVQNGTLKEQDAIVIGNHCGKVRAMVDDRGKKLKEVPPSVPVEILGLEGVPEAGEQFFVVPNEKSAKEISLKKLNIIKQKEAAPIKRITLEELSSQVKEGKIKELKIILKTDVQGSCEALKTSLTKLSTAKVELNIIHSGVGMINDADLILAAASNAIVIGFNIGMTQEAQTRSKQEGVDVRLYRIIYDVTSDVRSAMEGLLEPKIEEIPTGTAKVLQVFKVSKTGMVAGSMIQKGTIARGAMCRLIRGQEEVYKGKISSLKRFKDDVKEVKEGFECGIFLDNFKDAQPGDIIEAFEIKKTASKL